MQLIILEPFSTGSHEKFVKILSFIFPQSSSYYELEGKKWHWRLQCSAAIYATSIPHQSDGNFVLLASSMVNLADLVALRPDLQRCKRKVLYFHENQYAYPSSSSSSSSSQRQSQSQTKTFNNDGYAQVMSALVADVVLFNSLYNLNSFLAGLKQQMAMIPKDCRPPTKILDQIQAKSRVLFFPIDRPLPYNPPQPLDSLHVVWNHRWEHDKNPELLFSALAKIRTRNICVSVIGEKTNSNSFPSVFSTNMSHINLLHFGYVEDVDEYRSVLKSADVVLSTANQEFFGISMLEGVSYGAVPLAPNRLSYQELYPRKECLYNTESQLCKRLENWAGDLDKFRNITRKKILAKINMEKFYLDGGGSLKNEYELCVMGGGGGEGGGGGGTWYGITSSIWCSFIAAIFAIICLRILISPHECLVGLGVDYNSQRISGKAELQAYYAGSSCAVSFAILSMRKGKVGLLVILCVLGGFIVGRFVNYNDNGKDNDEGYDGGAEVVFFAENVGAAITLVLLMFRD